MSIGTRTRWHHRAVALVLLLFAGGAAAGIEVELSSEAGPHYAGVPIRLQLVVATDSDEQPTVQAPDIAAGQLEATGVRTHSNSRVSIINGRIERQEDMRFVYGYHLTVNEAGPVRIGPFNVVADGQAEASNTIELQVRQVPTSTRQRFEVIVPDGPWRVGQHVPLRIEWQLPADAVERIINHQAQIPLLSFTDALRFEPSDPGNGNTALQVVTPGGQAQLPAEVRRTTLNGEDQVIITVRQTLIPQRAGRYEVPAPSLTVEQATGWSRDLFGSRVPRQMQPLRIGGRARTLEILPLPQQGQPPHFSGAIGEGFSIAAQASNSVVQAGEPVRLRVTLRGDAPPEELRLPPLQALGLDGADFRLPRTPPPGRVADGARIYEFDLRVRHPGVQAIPALPFSWFDPVREDYQTTHSEPIALSVSPAQVVSADDVVSRSPAAEPTGDTGAPAATAPAAAPETAARGVLATADLSIETRPERLFDRRADSPRAQQALTAGLYATGLLCALVGLWARRRDSAAARALRALRARVEATRHDIITASTPSELAGALRSLATEHGNLRSPTLEAVLAECDQLAYAPAPARGVPDALRQRALTLLGDPRAIRGSHGAAPSHEPPT